MVLHIVDSCCIFVENLNNTVMNKEIVIKESARTKGKRECAAALKVARSTKSAKTSTKAGIFIKRLAKQIILF